MAKFSAVLLSWKRRHNLPAILASLQAIDDIGEILIWNNDPGVTLAFEGVKVFNSPANYKCFARYALASLASHEHIWFQDDDVLFRPEQFHRLRDAYLADPGRIVGPKGRRLVGTSYVADDAFGEVDIVIGLAMMFHKALLQHAFDSLALLKRPEVCDDISFSLLCGRKHLALDVGSIADLGMTDGAALSSRPDHFVLRQARVDLTLAARAERRPADLVAEVRRLEDLITVQQRELVGLREQLSSRTVRAVQRGITIARAAVRIVRPRRGNPRT